MSYTPTESPAVCFRAVLTPNRSLSATGFLVLMGLVTLVNIAVGVAFLLLGAWPVFLFCGLDVALIYVAFRLNYRAGRLSETIELDSAQLSFVRIHPSGARETYAFNPYWARVRLQQHPRGGSELRLASHGRDLAFAQFLNDDERREFASLLSDELAAVRTRVPGA